MNATTTSAQREEEPSSAASMAASLIPLALIVIMFVVFMRWLRRANGRAEDCMKLYREMISELRAIRAALEKDRAD
jgi:hypothetical protein